MATVLVTGGAGYIGSHVLKELARTGHATIALDSLVRGHRDAVKWGEFEHADLADPPAIKRVFERHSIDLVMHFAAFAYVGESNFEPQAYYVNNVANTLNLLVEMKRAACRKMVFSSTCAVYGELDRVPVTEDHPRRPINPYGRSKWMVEHILDDHRLAHGFETIVLRYFNAAGADQEGEIGERHEPETHIVPLALAAAATGGTVVINGGDYPTPDGSAIRDYIHVSDIAKAHVLAAERLLRGGASGVFNLGNGNGYSIREVVACVERVTGRRLHCEIGPRRPGDPPMLIGSAEAAARDLGWRPELPELERIVETAWRWYLRERS